MGGPQLDSVSDGSYSVRINDLKFAIKNKVRMAEAVEQDPGAIHNELARAWFTDEMHSHMRVLIGIEVSADNEYATRLPRRGTRYTSRGASHAARHG
jgi:hypothetical protein